MSHRKKLADLGFQPRVTSIDLSPRLSHLAINTLKKEKKKAHRQETC